MSPTFGGAPPALGASDLRVDPQALWDVGLALQRVRDAAATMRQSIAQTELLVWEDEVRDDLPSVAETWRQIYLALTESRIGLATQAQALMGVLDSAMLNLRATIERYVEAERIGQQRLAKVGE